jgi:NAD(P)-dependent dehydrogenase (short-subunit alcohol dehydrogenase family)
MQCDLAARAVLVTGAARGLGRAIALAAAAARRSWSEEEAERAALFLAALFVLSGISAFINGEALHVDGGLVLSL